MTCKDCKYAKELRNGSFLCFGQKNALAVDADDCCENWKPNYVSVFDKIKTLDKWRLAWFLAERLPLCYGCDASTVEDCAKCIDFRLGLGAR